MCVGESVWLSKVVGERLRRLVGSRGGPAEEGTLILLPHHNRAGL